MVNEFVYAQPVKIFFGAVSDSVVYNAVGFLFIALLKIKRRLLCCINRISKEARAR